MDEVKFSIRSLSNPNLIRRKSDNDITVKDKERSDRFPDQKQKKPKDPAEEEAPEATNGKDPGEKFSTDKEKRLDVFI